MDPRSALWSRDFESGFFFAPPFYFLLRWILPYNPRSPPSVALPPIPRSLTHCPAISGPSVICKRTLPPLPLIAFKGCVCCRSMSQFSFTWRLTAGAIELNRKKEMAQALSFISRVIFHGPFISTIVCCLHYHDIHDSTRYSIDPPDPIQFPNEHRVANR